MRLFLFASAGAVCLAVAGCASYSPEPLPQSADLSEMLPPQVRQPLDMNAVATVAVVNNRDLRSARAKAMVSDAEAYAAGILPNPQLNAELVNPTNQGSVGGTGYSFGLSYDIQALILQPAKEAAANSTREQAHLDLLWQEWQTVAQARTFYVQRIAAAEKRDLYATAEEKFVAQADRTTRALMTGDVTFDQAGVDLAALLDTRSQLRSAERAVDQMDNNLRGLLGMAHDVKIPLVPLAVPPIPDREAVETALSRVADSRPDLRALKAGYEGQEENLRKAVLAQFPSLSLGASRVEDTAGDTSSFGNVIHAVSIGATLNLPLFDRNQGEIAVQTATRGQLRAEYQARLDQAATDAWRVWAEMQELNNAVQELQSRLPELQTAAANAERAYQAGDLPVITYATLQNALLTRQSEISDLRQALWSDAIALSSVIGTQIQPEVDNQGPVP